MKNELDILQEVSAKFASLQIPYMLTGSLALSFYEHPRMTRDIDFVIDVTPDDGARLVAALEDSYYIPQDLLQKAIRNRSQFNLIHLESVIKVDCMVRKDTEFAKSEFSRRQAISRGTLDTVVVSREDLILAKLAWAKPSHSEIQLRDVRNLLESKLDQQYLDAWAATLGLRELLEECRRG